MVFLMLCGLACSPKKQIEITASDSGKNIELKSGGCFNIVLEGNPTTGYTWDAAVDTSQVLKQIKDPEYRSKSKLIGSGGKFTFHYKAVRSGKTELKFAYRRRWEKLAPARTFDLKITVK